MTKWKQRMLCCSAALALAGGAAAITHALDLRGGAEPAQPAQAVQAASRDALAEFETSRQQLRARRKAQLNELIHDASADEDTLRAARQQLLSDMEEEKQEETLQGILRARGFEGAVASVRGGTANILVRSQGLNRQESAVILELVMRQTGISGGNVKIIPIN